MSFSKYANLYLDFKKHELKYSTFCKYEGIVNLRLLPYFGSFDIADIKPSDIKKWLYSIDDVGSKSKRHYLGVLSGIMQEALFDEVIDKNPVKYIRIPKYYSPVIKPFTADQVQMILDNVQNFNYRVYLAIAFYTGMRSGEIIGLKKEDINLDAGLIRVVRSRSRFGETTPKTRYSIRELPIIELLKPYLIEIMNSHDKDYLFITQYKEPYRDTHVFTLRYWKPLLKELGIEYRRPYNTRHTYATNMLYRNLVSPVQLAQLLGHSSTQMVYDVYVKYVETNYKNFDRSMNIYR